MDDFKGRIERVKSALPLEDVARELGLEIQKVGRYYRARCPELTHADTKPSFTIDPRKRTYRCYGCGIRGDALDLVRLVRGCELVGAIEYLEGAGGKNGNGRAGKNGGGGVGGGGGGVELDPVALLAEPWTLEALEKLQEHYEGVFESREEGRAYLAKRGFRDTVLLDLVRAGYSDGSARELFTQEERRRLGGLGLFNERGNECFYKCVTFPLTDSAGRIVGFYGRRTEGKGHLYCAGPRRGVFFPKEGREGVEGRREKLLVLAESVLDAVAWVELQSAPVTAIYGTNGLTPEVEALLAKLDYEELVIAFDGDEAGESAVERYLPRLRELGFKTISRVAYPEGVKDAADLLLTGVPGIANKLLEERRTLGEFGPAPAARGASPRIRFQDGELFYEVGDLYYRLSGLDPSKGTSRRQAVLLKRGEILHADEVRLFSARERERFKVAAAARLGVQEARIEEDLVGILAWLDAHAHVVRPTKGERAAPSTKKPTGAEKEEAMAFLRDPRLLARVAEDLEKVGYVGAEGPKILAYLIGLSRRLERPLSGVIKSTTGAGKSALMERVVELMVPDEVFYLSRMTAASLYYFGAEELRHKLLVIDETEGLEEALYPLRSFQERSRLTLAVPVRQGTTGRPKTTLIEVEGPVAVLQATTRPRLQREDENRNLPITLVEDTDQTRLVHDHHKRRYTLEGYQAADRAARIRRRHHVAQLLLTPVRVLIPFQEKIRFPDVRPETSRDARRFLSLIEVLAYFHQHQRPHEKRADGHTYVAATLEDYRAAYRLAGTLIYASLDELAPQERLLYQRIRSEMAGEAARQGMDPERYQFTRRELRERTGLSQDYLKRYLRRLVELELLVVASREGRGGRFLYRLGLEEKAPAVGHLTTPEELEAATCR